MGLFGSIGKFLLGGKKKTTSSKSTGTSDYDPYAPVIPHLDKYLADTDALYGPGGAPIISDYEQRGYDELERVASTPGTVDAAIAENNKTLRGEYLSSDTNPYLKEIANRMGSQAFQGANASFSGAGRTGSGLAGYYAGKGASEAVGDVYNTNYQAERGRMSGAVGMAPSLEAGRYLPAQARISAGQNISARPFDVNQMRGGILSQIAGLGQQGKTTGTQQNYAQQQGLVGKIATSFTNKLFNLE